MKSQYNKQLNYVFNRPTGEPAWYWQTYIDEETAFNDSPNDTFFFLETLLLNAKIDLIPYSDEQIGLGLTYVFDNSCSNIINDFKIADIVFERKLKAINSIFGLFRDVLNPRCPSLLAAYSNATLSKISYICYMFWDICPLSSTYGFNFNEARKSKLFDENYLKAIANVMKQCLGLSNPACIESGLHGLGHMVFNQPQIAVPIIDNFLNSGHCKNNELINYAKNARKGMIP
jgi:hypothetical protein